MINVCVCTQSCPFFATPWTVAHQAPPCTEVSRQQYWSGLPFPPAWDLPNPRIKPQSLVSPALADGSFTTNGTNESKQGRGNRLWEYFILVRVRPYQWFFTRFSAFLLQNYHLTPFVLTTFLYSAKNISQIMSNEIQLSSYLKAM